MFAGELKKQKVFFAIADVSALGLAIAVALRLHDPSGAMRAHLEDTGIPILIECVSLAAILWVGVFQAFDLYEMLNGSRQEAIGIVKACSAAAVLMLLASFAAHFQIQISRASVAIFVGCSIVIELAMRLVIRNVIQEFYSRPNISIPLVIIGFNPISHLLCDRLQKDLSLYELLRFLDADSIGREYCGYPKLGRPEQ